MHTLGVLLPQLVENVGGIETGVLAELTRNYLHRLRERCDDQLLLAMDTARVLAQVLGQLHLEGGTHIIKDNIIPIPNNISHTSMAPPPATTY